MAQILIKLNSGEKFSVEELSEEFNVDKRTVQRDLRDRLSYLPIKKDGGYYSLEPHALGRLGFEDLKRFAAVSGVKTLYPSLSNGFISKVLDCDSALAYLVKNYERESLEQKSDDFDALGKAILKHTKVNFSYKNKERSVNPYKLVNNNGVWYLVADEDGVLKNFAVSKIINLQTTDASFAPNAYFLSTIEKNELGWFSQNTIEVTLKIKSCVAEYFLRRKLLPNQQIVEHTSEYLTLRAKASYDDEILGAVKYWLPNVVIISPPYLQQKLNDILTGYIAEQEKQI